MTLRDPIEHERQNIAVEYTQSVLEDIEAHVAGNFERPSGGGVESGGVLFGTHSRRIVTVSAMRPAACSYASGPVFVLCPADHRQFEETLKQHSTDPSLTGLEPVGWFLSHVRDSLVLRPADREIFDRYFAQQWQIALVMRPGRVGSLRAATIGRDIETRAETVLNEFTIRQAPGGEAPAAEARLEPPDGEAITVRVAPHPKPPTSAPDPAPPASAPPALSMVRRESIPLMPYSVPPPTPPRRMHWPAVALAALIALLLTLAATVFVNAKAPDSIGLQAFERDGILRIEWNPEARSVSRATSGKLTIGEEAVKNLSKEDLKRGFFAALRKQDDVTARLELYDAAGKVKREQTRYIGRPMPAEKKPEPPVPDRMKEENSALQNELSRERERTDELERRVKVLQTIIHRRDGK